MNWPQLSPKVRDTLTAMAAMLGAVSVALWRVGKPAVMLVLKALLALIVIFEEWGWEPLAALMARLGRLRPWALAEAWVAALPPYAALVVFVLPGALLFPFKLVAIWLFAGGHVLLAGVTFVLAKLVGTAFLARIFMLTKPALMQIGWFERTYHRFIPWKDAAEGWLRESGPGARDASSNTGRRSGLKQWPRGCVPRRKQLGSEGARSFTTPGTRAGSGPGNSGLRLAKSARLRGAVYSDAAIFNAVDAAVVSSERRINAAR